MEDIQNKWFLYYKSAFQFRSCPETNYKTIPYGKPYEILLRPNLQSIVNDGTLMIVFDQPHLVNLRTTFRKLTRPYREANNVTYFFVMAMESDNPSMMQQVYSESEHFGDILLFNHTNSYHNLALSVLLTYHYLQALELPLKYIVKMDSDCALNLPSLMSILYSPSVFQRKYLYAGDCLESRYNTYDPTKKNYVPFCIVADDNYIASYARGGLYVLTYNLVKPLLISTRHFTFLTHHEDGNTGKALNALGFQCHSLGEEHWIARNGCNSKDKCRQYLAIHPRRSSGEARKYYRMIFGTQIDLWREKSCVCFDPSLPLFRSFPHHSVTLPIVW